MNRLTTSTETESMMYELPQHKGPGSDGFTGKFCQTFREELTPTFLKLFQEKKMQSKEHLQTHSMKPPSP